MRRRGFLKAALGGVLAVALPIPVLPRLVNAGTGASVVIHNHPYMRRDTAYICPGSLDDLFGYTPAFDLESPLKRNVREEVKS